MPDCTMPLEPSAFAVLPNVVSCSLSNICTGVTCCVHSEEAGRNFHLSMKVDSCARIITVEIEQIHFEIIFEEFRWGMLFL